MGLVMSGQGPAGSGGFKGPPGPFTGAGGFVMPEYLARVVFSHHSRSTRDRGTFLGRTTPLHSYSYGSGPVQYIQQSMGRCMVIGFAHR